MCLCGGGGGGGGVTGSEVSWIDRHYQMIMYALWLVRN